MKISSVVLALIFFLIANTSEASQKYVIKKGDTLSKIAKKFRVDQQKILDANNLDSDALTIGARLTIPQKETAREKHASRREAAETVRPAKNSTADSVSRKEAPESQPALQEASYHTVTKGDTLASIARKYSLTVKDLKELNGLTRKTKLKQGQQLLVKRAGPRTYTVRKGDNIWKIAKKFGMSPEEILDLNEVDSEDLTPGQKLVLEARTEPQDVKNYPSLSAAKLSEDIKTLAESTELESLGMKDRLILFARKMLNIPYRFGGSTFMGIDCSGYVQKVFGFLDVSLPRTAREQFHLGEPVSKEDLSIGDLVFFRTYASFPSHVGIYLGNNLFIHASSKNRKVSIDSLETPYYIKRFIGAKRLFPDELLDKQINLNEQG